MTAAPIPTSSAVAPRAPPRRSAPRTTSTPPSPPTAPPNPPATASSQPQGRAPTSTPPTSPAAKAAGVPPRTAASAPARRTPSATPKPATSPAVYHVASNTCLAYRPFAQSPDGEGRSHGSRRPAAARLFLPCPLGARKAYGKPACAHRPQGADAAA